MHPVIKIATSLGFVLASDYHGAYPSRWVPDERTNGTTQVNIPQGMAGCVQPNSSAMSVCWRSPSERCDALKWFAPRLYPECYGKAPGAAHTAPVLALSTAARQSLETARNRLQAAGGYLDKATAHGERSDVALALSLVSEAKQKIEEAERKPQ